MSTIAPTIRTLEEIYRAIAASHQRSDKARKALEIAELEMQAAGKEAEDLRRQLNEHNYAQIRLKLQEIVNG